MKQVVYFSPPAAGGTARAAGRLRLEPISLTGMRSLPTLLVASFPFDSQLSAPAPVSSRRHVRADGKALGAGLPSLSLTSTSA